MRGPVRGSFLAESDTFLQLFQRLQALRFRWGLLPRQYLYRPPQDFGLRRPETACQLLQITNRPGIKRIGAFYDRFRHMRTVWPYRFTVNRGSRSDEWAAVGRGEIPGHVYSRNTNPTVDDFESRTRLPVGAEDATSFATGMAAISNTLFTLLSPGDRVVAIKDTYGGTTSSYVSTK